MKLLRLASIACVSALLAACGVDAVGTGTTTDPTPTLPAQPPPAAGATQSPGDVDRPDKPDPGTPPQSACADGALGFSGTGQLATVPDAPALDLPGDFTIEAWVLPASTAKGNEMFIVSHHDSVASQGWSLSVLDGRFEVGLYGDDLGNIEYAAGNAGDAYVVPNKWVLVSASLSGDVLRIYADGKLKDSQKLGGLFGRRAYKGPLAFGRASSTAVGAFTGEIAELRLSKGARYTQDSFTRPNAPMAPDATTIALFPFDEPGGDTIDDVSGSGHDGLLAAASQAPTRAQAPCVTTR